MPSPAEPAARDVRLREALADERSGRVAFISHCLLNENARYLGGAFRAGAVNEVIEPLLRDGVGICQMPCPEQVAWGGVGKPLLVALYARPRLRPWVRAALPVLVAWTRLRYRRLASSIGSEIAAYQRSGADVIGIVGVGASPSCGVRTTLAMGPALDALVGCPRALLDRDAATAAVARNTRPGRGLFVDALARDLARRGLRLPVLEHDLRSEWPDATVRAGAHAAGVTRPRPRGRPSSGLVRATRRVLEPRLGSSTVAAIVAEATRRRGDLVERIPPNLNRGGRHLLGQGAFTIGVDEALLRRGLAADVTAVLVAEIVVEANRGALAWVHRLGWLRHRAPLERLRWEGRLLFATYYRRPAWAAEPVEVPDGYGFDMRHCAIADFYRDLGLGDRCEQTICALDAWAARQYAEPAGFAFRRAGTIAGGADRCDFRYVPASPGT